MNGSSGTGLEWIEYNHAASRMTDDPPSYTKAITRPRGKQDDGDPHQHHPRACHPHGVPKLYGKRHARIHRVYTLPNEDDEDDVDHEYESRDESSHDGHEGRYARCGTPVQEEREEENDGSQKSYDEVEDENGQEGSLGERGSGRRESDSVEDAQGDGVAEVRTIT